MIKSHHPLFDLDKMAKVFFREINSELRIRQKLVNWPNDNMRPVMNYLLNNLKQIITARPDKLESYILLIQPLINQAIINHRPTAVFPLNKNGTPYTVAQQDTFLKNWARNEIRKVINYDGFISTKNGAIAYRHAKRLNTNVCPYCNSQFTFTIKNKLAKTRPQFDHFLNKATYPFLALSFYNLIPSCPVCNSTGVKGEDLFSYTTHLHPFLDDMTGLYQFRTKVDAVDFLVNDRFFDLNLEPCKGANKNDKKRAKRSITDFALNNRYKFHKDYAGEIITKAYIYNQESLEQLFTSFNIDGQPIFKSKSEIKEMIIGNYLEEGKLHKRILSKLAKDIAEEFGLTI